MYDFVLACSNYQYFATVFNIKQFLILQLTSNSFFKGKFYIFLLIFQSILMIYSFLSFLTYRAVSFRYLIQLF